ncbi:hypothetical protein P8C59_000426 [Phyllachora maydis]|uniref:Uncharacterized protein n=1 Tax=Phyllachora maydis TaxID=1825666 RepID=A0AAD9HX69_9PEZI|nr:hypothetical protein P8C59_000426 [Phyllachora maydis]
MASSSTLSVFQGNTAAKADHSYTRTPPTHHSTTKASLAAHRISTFSRSGQDTGVVLPARGADMGALAVAREQKTLRALEAVSAKLPPASAQARSFGGPRELELD